MLAQHAVFTIHNVDTPIENPRGRRCFLARITIPPDAVDVVRNAVSKFGIDQHTLFPDLDNLAEWVSTLYPS